MEKNKYPLNAKDNKHVIASEAKQSLKWDRLLRFARNDVV